MRPALRFVVVVAALTAPPMLSGCGEEAPPAAVAEDVQADVRVLLDAVLQDVARLPLQEVDEAIRDERPVLAADLIEQGAKPATERQIERLRALPLTSAEGRRLRARAVRLFRARLDALEHLRVALARGIGQEDGQLLDAMHADAEAQIAIVALEDELARRGPDAREAPSIEGRGAPPRLPSREESLLEDPRPAERPEDPNPGAAEPIAIPEPE